VQVVDHLDLVDHLHQNRGHDEMNLLVNLVQTLQLHEASLEHYCLSIHHLVLSVPMDLVVQPMVIYQ
jgi:hypothetical protein